MSKNEVSYLAGAEQAIPLERLRPFANHPFQVRHDLEMRELMDSIGESGIITPILVRPKENGLYEVISGHRRWEACKELGVQQIPAKVLYLDDDEATVLMVNSNIQREHVLPSEKAFAYKMRMEAMPTFRTSRKSTWATPPPRTSSTPFRSARIWNAAPSANW